MSKRINRNSIKEEPLREMAFKSLYIRKRNAR